MLSKNRFRIVTMENFRIAVLNNFWKIFCLQDYKYMFLGQQKYNNFLSVKWIKTNTVKQDSSIEYFWQNITLSIFHISYFKLDNYKLMRLSKKKLKAITRKVRLTRQSINARRIIIIWKKQNNRQMWVTTIKTYIYINIFIIINNNMLVKIMQWRKSSKSCNRMLLLKKAKADNEVKPKPHKNKKYMYL